MNTRIGVEPYTAAEMRRYLTSAYGLTGRVRRLKGSHLTLELADGREVPFHDKQITRHLARQIAAALGISYPELRRRLGVPLATGARTGRATALSGPDHITKSDVLRAAHEVRTALDDLLSPFASGQRDMAAYEQAFARLAVARRAISGEDI